MLAFELLVEMIEEKLDSLSYQADLDRLAEVVWILEGVLKDIRYNQESEDCEYRCCVCDEAQYDKGQWRMLNGDKVKVCRVCAPKLPKPKKRK